MRRIFKSLGIAAMVALSACNENSGGSGSVRTFYPVAGVWLESDGNGFVEFTGIPYTVDWSICTATTLGDDHEGTYAIDCAPADDADSAYAGDFQHPSDRGVYFRRDANTLMICSEVATLCGYWHAANFVF